MTPVWTLISWPTVWYPAQRHVSIATKLHHLSTSINPDKDEEGNICGQVLFGIAAQEEEVFGVAWDWVAISGRIVAMADPMAVTSNIRFVGPDGDVLQENARIVELNNVINCVPWQRPVRRALPQRKRKLLATPRRPALSKLRASAPRPMAS